MDVLVPIDAGGAVMSGKLDEEVFGGEEGLKLNLNSAVLGGGVMVDALNVVPFDEFAGALVVTEEVVDGLL